jgi:hypothetical protein
MKRIFPMTAVALVLAVAPAQAETQWGINPNSCTPSGSTIAKHLLKSGFQGPEFAGDKTGQITLFCPVTGTITAQKLWTLRMTYQDSTGTNTSASVRVDLFNIQDGEDSSSIPLSVNSDSATAKNLATLDSPPAIMSFEFTQTAWWVRIILKRSKPTQRVRINSIFIMGTDPI